MAGLPSKKPHIHANDSYYVGKYFAVQSFNHKEEEVKR